MTSKKAYAIQHVGCEDLGTLENVLLKQNYQIKYFDAATDDLHVIQQDQPDLLIVLGGPIGVYDHAEYPFLKTEVAILQERLAQDLPTIGICLGSQLIAQALGSNVYPGGKKEIGWSGLTLTPHGKQNYFQYLCGTKTQVLHWHGDTFELPKNAVLQASSAIYPHQAFTYKKNILAVQFHPEVTELAMEKWFVGHAHEIFSQQLSVSDLRHQTKLQASKLSTQAQKFWEEWLIAIGRI